MLDENDLIDSLTAALASGAVGADYAARWGELTPTTLEQCTLFCQQVKVQKDSPDVPLLNN